MAKCLYFVTIQNMTEKIIKTALRLPVSLHEKIHESADSSGRSMNAEIVFRLGRSFDPVTGDGTEIARRFVNTYHDFLEEAGYGLYKTEDQPDAKPKRKIVKKRGR